jgi:ppGpp synthetase/RelA/SpoT-type nucleotidyltranferase
MSTPPTNSENRLRELRKEYEALRPTAEKFRNELRQQLEALTTNADVKLGFPVEARVKAWDSIASKLDRLHLQLGSIRELQDLVGARVIVLFRRDVERLCRLVEETFAVVAKEDTGQRLREDQFGYSSTHYTIKLPKEWQSLPSLSTIGDLSAEVQVRTVSQHIWAAASHILQYKDETNVPLPVRRSIHRVSALLETVDLEFERVLTEREEYRAGLSPKSLEPLNTDSLEQLLDTLLPKENKADHEAYSVLLKELNDFGITTAAQLVQMMTKHMPAVLEMDKKMVARRTAEKDYTKQDEKRILEKKVFFLQVGLVRSAMHFEFGERWERYMQNLAKMLRR